MYAPLVLASALFLVKSAVRLVLFGILAVGATALVYSESRASLLALPIGVCMLLWASGRGRYAVAGLLLVTILAAFPDLLPEKATERFEATYEEHLSRAGVYLDKNAASRLVVWQGALRIISEHPFGIGFEQFKGEIQDYAYTHEYALDAHNYYLLAWAEFGLIGLIVLLRLLYRMLANAWALARHGPDHFMRSLGLGLWACLMAALFVNCFGSRLMDIQVSTYLWVLSAVAAAARDTVYEEEVEALVEVAPAREDVWGLRSYS